MRKKSNYIQQIGVVFTIIATITLFSDSASPLVVASIYILGIVTAIVGGLMGDMGKSTVLALVVILLAVIVYFSVGSGMLLNILLGISVFLIIIDLIQTMRVKRIQK